MARTYALRVYLTKDESETLKQRCDKKRFRGLSDYARYLILERTSGIEEKIYLIYELLKKQNENKN